MDKSPDAFRTISEVADELDVPQHVLRFWETRFSQIKPMKRGGGRRYYRPNDVDLLSGIRRLLYGQGYTIRGVQRILREAGVSHVVSIGRGDVVPDTVELAQKPAPVPESDPEPVSQPEVEPAAIEPEPEPEPATVPDVAAGQTAETPLAQDRPAPEPPPPGTAKPAPLLSKTAGAEQSPQTDPRVEPEKLSEPARQVLLKPLAPLPSLPVGHNQNRPMAAAAAPEAAPPQPEPLGLTEEQLSELRLVMTELEAARQLLERSSD